MSKLKKELTTLTLKHNQVCKKLEKHLTCQADWDLVQEFKHPFQEVNDLYVSFLKSSHQIRILQEGIASIAVEAEARRVKAIIELSKLKK